MARKPVGVSQAHGANMMVVCDDGSVWMYQNEAWAALEPIPGTDAAAAKTKRLTEAGSPAREGVLGPPSETARIARDKY